MNYQAEAQSSSDEEVMENEAEPEQPEYWNVEEEEILEDIGAREDQSIQDNTTKENEYASMQKLVHLTMLFLLLWGSKYGVSSNGLNQLVGYLHYLCTSLGPYTPFAVAQILASFPTTLYMLRKKFCLQGDAFVRYTVCPSCNSIYSSDGQQKFCTHVQFPNHPHRSRRKPCGMSLNKEVVLKNGKKILYPKKVYCYRKLKESLYLSMERKGMLLLCEHWRNRCVPSGCLADVYDGRVWKEFGDFFGQPHNLGLMLNCDWFQPYDFTEYSVGVIYMVILNLPRSLRFKPENVIIVGIIPGPDEPSLTINSFLRPLVTELNELWVSGIRTSENVTLRAALLCVACDLPAAHKVCGFLSHSSCHACSRCTKLFKYDETLNRVIYSGFDYHAARTQNEHKAAGEQWLAASTRAQRETVEKETGSRYTELNRLPYFDCIRFTCIDPMHNLFLGTAKYIMKNIWLSEKHAVLDRKDNTIIHDCVANAIVPTSVGRIPRKILSGFASFSADQWKNWTIIYSVVALHGVIPDRDMKCWKMFVKMCILFCTSLISITDIEEAHTLSFQFGQTVQDLYGEDAVTPNMHLHCHLKECILDFGPVYGFWLFSFERYNGILGGYHTNQKSIEIQVMRRFLSDMSVRYTAVADPIVQEHIDLFAGILDGKVKGSIAEAFSVPSLELPGDATVAMLSLINLPVSPVQPSSLYLTNKMITNLSSYKIKLFDSDDLRYLKISYSYFLPSVDLNNVAASYEMYTSLQMWDELYGSKESRLERHSYIQAHWVKRDGYIDPCSSCQFLSQCDDGICAMVYATPKPT